LEKPRDKPRAQERPKKRRAARENPVVVFVVAA